ncbi:MAG: hypothetical protein EKK64_00895 [Neisseriaceae bacterium]|nr:MAG: hypothetical protein EKK64_00895 [Neisseriaceae bacterium]
MKRFVLFAVFLLVFSSILFLFDQRQENVSNFKKIQNTPSQKEIFVSFNSILDQPLEIVNSQEIEKVQDEDLKNFISSKVDFEKQKVLYFEWVGNPNDYLVASLVCSLDENNNKYLISIKKDKLPSGEKVSHKQIFIVSTKYPYQIDSR